MIWTSYFKKNFIPVINKPGRVSRNNATIIDHVNTNYFLNNGVHPEIITTNIPDHFPIFLISQDLMLDSSNELIHITKAEINHKCMAYFKIIFSIVDWKHVLHKLPTNNAWYEFLRYFFDLYNKAFVKQKIKTKRKCFNRPGMTKGIVKSSKKEQRLYEIFLKNRNPERKCCSIFIHCSTFKPPRRNLKNYYHRKS